VGETEAVRSTEATALCLFLICCQLSVLPRGTLECSLKKYVS
jgi:hypothetical protein